MKKINLSKWWRHVHVKSIVKSLLLSVMGTTISILLTFGSSRAELKPDILEYVDSWHQANRKSQAEAREKGEETVNYAAFIDRSETKLQWSHVKLNPDGTEETSTLYLTKQSDE